MKRPIFALAPMADVTDEAFRRIIAKYGKPDVLWTEFVACDGLCSPKGRERLLIDLKFDMSERPIVAQLFGSKPDHMEECARLIKKLGFDGLDINMGCPDKTIEKQGAGAALIKNPKLAVELITAAKRGAGDMPVSVKTRIGYNTNILESWLPILLEAEPAVITIHARTRKEMSKVSANWDTIGEAVRIAKKYNSSPSRTLILGNGDVRDMKDAEEKVKQYGVDGVMLGRAIFGNPWLFSRNYEGKEIPTKERLRVMTEHTKLFEKMYKGAEPRGLMSAVSSRVSSGRVLQSASYSAKATKEILLPSNFSEKIFKVARRRIKRFDVMKKHYKAYASGFDGAKELRIELMATKSANDVEQIVKKFLKSSS